MARKLDDIHPDSAPRQRIYGGLPSPLGTDAAIKQARAEIATGRPLADIALDFGYSSTGNFGTAFRQKTGESPTEYAKSIGVTPKRRRRHNPAVGLRTIKDRTHLPELPKIGKKKRRKRKKPPKKKPARKSRLPRGPERSR